MATYLFYEKSDSFLSALYQKNVPLTRFCFAIARIYKSYYRLKMQIQVKLFATYRDYLPPDCTRGVQDMEVQEGETAVFILDQLGVPTDAESVILVNGRSPQPDQPLQEGDVVCAFPAIAGG